MLCIQFNADRIFAIVARHKKLEISKYSGYVRRPHFLLFPSSLPLFVKVVLFNLPSHNIFVVKLNNHCKICNRKFFIKKSLKIHYTNCVKITSALVGNFVRSDFNQELGAHKNNWQTLTATSGWRRYRKKLK